MLVRSRLVGYFARSLHPCTSSEGLRAWRDAGSKSRTSEFGSTRHGLGWGRRRSTPALRMKKLLYHRREAAFILALPLATIDTLITDGRLSARTFEGNVVIPAREVRRLAREIIAGEPTSRVTTETPVPLAGPIKKANGRFSKRDELEAEPRRGPDYWRIKQVATRLQASEDTVKTLAGSQTA